jgi:hypothetical protein
VPAILRVLDVHGLTPSELLPPALFAGANDEKPRAPASTPAPSHSPSPADKGKRDARQAIVDEYLAARPRRDRPPLPRQWRHDAAGLIVRDSSGCITQPKVRKFMTAIR